MKKLFRNLFQFILCAFCLSYITILAQPVNQPLTTTDKQVAASTEPFGINLLREISNSDTDINIFISPLSVSTALGMTINGATGNTYDQMKSTLRLPGNTQDEINRSFLNIGNILTVADTNIIFNDANSIWCRQGTTFEQRFLDINKTFFNAEIQSLDFNSHSSVDAINNWARINTKGKISQIISGIPGDAVMYLINAIYFKAVWKYKFDLKSTILSPFHLADGGEVKCKLMYQVNNFNYYKSSDFAALEIPYCKDNIEMLVILPNDNRDINKMLDEFESPTFSQILSGMKSYRVILKLPKFEINYNISLKNTLKNLGLTDAFNSEGAEFPNINGTDKIYISDILHKTYIKVGEENTEAAAVTSIRMGALTAAFHNPPPPIPFIVDHPFLFFIMDKNSGGCLFAGKIVNPVK
jgi:serpin B